MSTLAFDTKRMAPSALHPSIFCLSILLLSLMTMVRPVHAAGTVPALVAGYYLPGSPTWTGLTPPSVCISHPHFCGAAPGLYVRSMTCGTVPGSSSGFCNTYTEAIAALPPCPPNATPSGASCTCDPNFQPDGAGTSCVPVSASDCPVTGLTPLTDPVAIDFENSNRWRPDGLTADFQFKLACVQKGISDRGGAYVGTSAYRPTQYQQHLFEIVDKDYNLDADYMIAHPECQVLRDKVTGEMTGHGLKFNQDVAAPGMSRHESRMAFDLTPSGLTDVQLAPVYLGCGVTHTAVPGEPWHVQ